MWILTRKGEKLTSLFPSCSVEFNFNNFKVTRVLIFLVPTCSEMRGEVFAPCAAPCDPTCDEPFPPCLASNSCSPRCACLSGRRRNANGVCVPPSECSPPLPPSTSSSETTTTPRVRSVSGTSCVCHVSFDYHFMHPINQILLWFMVLTYSRSHSWVSEHPNSGRLRLVVLSVQPFNYENKSGSK